MRKPVVIVLLIGVLAAAGLAGMAYRRAQHRAA